MTDRIRTIVAGVATLERDDPALAASIHLAKRTGAELHLVHVYTGEDDAPAWIVDAAPGGARHPSPAARRVERVLQAHAEALGAGDRFACVGLEGKAAESLPVYAAAAGADLLVLAPARRTGAGSAVLGDTTARVLRASSTPVLVLRDGLADHAARRVLLPTDLSEHSARALPLAGALAAALAQPDEPLLLSLFVSASDLDTGPTSLVAGLVEEAETEMHRFLASIPAVARMEGTVRVGSPPHEILAVAREWDADLVVLGTHGRRGLPRFFLGSVAETVLRKASCSALVIPPAAVRAEEDGWMADGSYPRMAAFV
jgi:nucleotide-binding universal stress UspA family protein